MSELVPVRLPPGVPSPVDVYLEFYGQDRAMADERACGTCGWPFAEAGPGCQHEAAADD